MLCGVLTFDRVLSPLGNLEILRKRCSRALGTIGCATYSQQDTALAIRGTKQASAIDPKPSMTPKHHQPALCAVHVTADSV